MCSSVGNASQLKAAWRTTVTFWRSSRPWFRFRTFSSNKCAMSFAVFVCEMNLVVRNTCGTSFGGQVAVTVVNCLFWGLASLCLINSMGMKTSTLNASNWIHGLFSLVKSWGGAWRCDRWYYDWLDQPSRQTEHQGEVDPAALPVAVGPHCDVEPRSQLCGPELWRCCCETGAGKTIGESLWQHAAALPRSFGLGRHSCGWAARKESKEEPSSESREDWDPRDGRRPNRSETWDLETNRHQEPPVACHQSQLSGIRKAHFVHRRGEQLSCVRQHVELQGALARVLRKRVVVPIACRRSHAQRSEENGNHPKKAADSCIGLQSAPYSRSARCFGGEAADNIWGAIRHCPTKKDIVQFQANPSQQSQIISMRLITRTGIMFAASVYSASSWHSYCNLLVSMLWFATWQQALLLQSLNWKLHLK